MLGIGTLAKKVFGTPNDRKVKSVRPLVAKINALESEVERLTIQQMFTARGDKEQWETGSELSQSAQESLKRRKEKIHAFLDGGR